MATATTITEVAAELRELATTLENSTEDTDVVEILRNHDHPETIVEDIVYEWPYTSTSTLANRAPSVLREALRDEGWLVFEDTHEARSWLSDQGDYVFESRDEAISSLVSDYPEDVQQELRDAGYGGIDTDEVERLSNRLAALADELYGVRYIDLEDVLPELENLSGSVNEVANELQSLL